MSSAATNQDIDDWLDANRDYFDEPVWDEQTCVISTTQNADLRPVAERLDPEMAWSLIDYKKAKEIARGAHKALRYVETKTTRDKVTGEVSVRVTCRA